MLSDWLFVKAALSGKNGYDSKALESEAKLANLDIKPIQRYNPPWYYIFFLPFVFLSAQCFLLITTLLSCLVSIYVGERSFRLFGERSTSLFLLFITVVLFPPTIANICFGQISSFLSLALIFAFSAFAAGRDLQSGFWLALLCVKPQSTYLIAIIMLIVALKEKRYILPLSYFSTVAILILTAYIAIPASFGFWKQVRFDLDWKTFTLSTYVRELLLYLTAKLFYFPIFFIPAITAVVASVLVLKNKLNAAVFFAVIPCISAITAPYGWFYDLTILIPSNCFIVDACIRRRCGYLPFLFWVAATFIGFMGVMYFDYLSLWYFPLSILFIAIWCHKLCNFKLAEAS